MTQSPKHYKDTKLMDLLIERKVPFAEGNIMKYVFRWEEKDGIKDLYKARDYLNALIASVELREAKDHWSDRINTALMPESIKQVFKED